MLGSPTQSWILDSTSWIPDSSYWIPVSGTWILDSSRLWDSGLLELSSGFQSPGFRITRAKYFRIPESEFLYMGRPALKTYLLIPGFDLFQHCYSKRFTRSEKSCASLLSAIWLFSFYNLKLWTEKYLGPALLSRIFLYHYRLSRIQLEFLLCFLKNFLASMTLDLNV